MQKNCSLRQQSFLALADFVFVFLFGSHAAPQMPLCFVFVQNGFDLIEQSAVDGVEPFGNIFMYSGFGYAVFFSGVADGGFMFNNVHCKLGSPFFYV